MYLYRYEPDMHGDADCSYLPDSFSRSKLKLDVKYTYNDKEYVQHQGIVTYDECTSKYIYDLDLYVGGYMTQDEQYCVFECDGIYKLDTSSTERICTCAKFIAPNGKTCLEECGPD